MKSDTITIVIAHYGLDRKITKEECLSVLTDDEKRNHIFVDFEAGNAKLSELYGLAFDNIALFQQRKFAEIVEPILKENPQAKIAYFGFAPIPIAFHFGYLAIKKGLTRLRINSQQKKNTIANVENVLKSGTLNNSFNAKVPRVVATVIFRMNINFLKTLNSLNGMGNNPVCAGRNLY